MYTWKKKVKIGIKTIAAKWMVEHGYSMESIFEEKQFLKAITQQHLDCYTLHGCHEYIG